MNPPHDPIYALTALSDAADWTEAFVRHPVYNAYMPITLLTILHTLRVSHATRMISGGKNSRLGLFQSVILDQIVLFAGSSILALAIGMPLPIMIAPFPIVLYSSVHILTSVTGFGDLLLDLHSHPVTGLFMDIVLCTIDALARTEGIVGLGFGMLAAHPDPRVANALTAKLFAGAILSGGIPLVAQAFQLTSPTGAWAPTAPAWLQRPALLLFPDLIGGVLLALVHVVLTHGAHAHAHSTVAIAAEKIFGLPAPKEYIPYTPYLSLRQAKVVDALVLFVVLAVPALTRRLGVLLAQSRTRTRASGRRSGKNSRAAARNKRKNE
ncbi:hypothetical protein MCUN1_001099 [Malassezia cuniculi]|uniref:Uncharacterized protein n=1 Tax=Malassezia cuniculi TaxID=948313 RepID=A0AAF0ETI6_9BASI|nr:hypothetical protein MCUN1_001099 [Malassezia cuniculi]